jgi:hypothetical protein
MYIAAAKIWTRGVAWHEALAIVKDAFDQATYEE